MRYVILLVWLVVVGVIIGWLGLAAAEDEAGKTELTNAPELSIPAVNGRGVRDWVAEDDRTLLIQDNFRKWYKVRLMVPSRHLLHAESIGFVTGPSGILDTTGAVVVRGQKTPVVSITASEGPKRQRR
ncbi:DUF6491 family protein [Zoogloea sp.]|uniref:DUF6491 family protein n=1 Tax=Zoogloea sp. TaxID=49181 RepID=UPI0035B00040